MSDEALFAVTREALVVMMVASLPVLCGSLVAGFLCGLFQATTQIQDATLSVVPRLAGAAVALTVCGPWVASQLHRFAGQAFLLVLGGTP